LIPATRTSVPGLIPLAFGNSAFTRMALGTRPPPVRSNANQPNQIAISTTSRPISASAPCSLTRLRIVQFGLQAS
jgi:hypothetical protein